MLKLTLILLGKLIKYFLFLLVLLEIVVVYFALTEEFANLIIGCINNKLIHAGYFFSIEEPIRLIFRGILPIAVLLKFIHIKYSSREGIIKTLHKVYKKITSLQLLICFIVMAIFSYYLNKFYILLYKKYKHCSL